MISRIFSIGFIVLFCCACENSTKQSQKEEVKNFELKRDTSLFEIDVPMVQGEVLEVEETLDGNMLQEQNNFAYTAEEIQQYFSKPYTLKYDFTGFDPNSVRKVPEPGVHPRVFFGPDELPELRERLKNTVPGQKIMVAIKKELNNNIRIEGSPTTAGYQALIKGDESVEIQKNISIAYGALYEAFRCLVEQDEEGGKQVAKAIVTIAKIDQKVIQKSIDSYKQKHPEAKRIDFRVTAKHPSQNGTLGLMYDWAYNFMNQQQRDIVRKAIVTASKNMTLQGAQNLRTIRTNSSNWISWTSRLVCLLAAIEGEEGYDPVAYQHSVQAMKWFFSLSIFPDGESHEGWGKQFLMAELAYIMARRGEYFFANQNVRNTFNKYWLHALNPWGRKDEEFGGVSGPFTFYDSQGGTKTRIPSLPDILVYKKLYPKDPAIDFIYRSAMAEDYGSFSQRINLRHHFSTYDGFCKAIFAMTFDHTKTWDEAHADLTKDKALTYFSIDTGNMITRSDWSSDALYFHYNNRSMPGGHKYSDRGHFNVYADGRYWGIYEKMRQVREAFLPMNRSTVIIDGEGVSIAPGKCVDHVSNDLTSFTVSDLKITYDYSHNYLFPLKGEDRKKKVMLPHSYNEFRLEPSEYPYYNLTQDMRPHWYDSLKKPYDQRMGGSNSAGWRKHDIPMKKAFRTAGMVRGKHPYILIVDDIQKDDQKRHYEWGMTLASDINLNKAAKDLAILGDDKNRQLVVQMLSADGLEDAPKIKEVRSKNPPQPDKVIPKLVFNSHAKAPSFKALIYPPRGEQAQVNWNEDRTQLTLTWSDQVDLITFHEAEDGRTRIKIQRQGNDIVEIK